MSRIDTVERRTRLTVLYRRRRALLTRLRDLKRQLVPVEVELNHLVIERATERQKRENKRLESDRQADRVTVALMSRRQQPWRKVQPWH